MDRIKKLLAAALLTAAFLALTTCDNPVDMLDEIEVKVMQANDRYLEVVGIYIPVDESGLFNPTGSMEITFDRAIDLDSVNPSTVVIKDENGDAIDYPSQGVSYVAASNMLRIRVYPFLPIDSDISLAVSGVLGADGSSIHDVATRAFATKNVLAGSVNSLVGHDTASLSGYTITNAIDFQVQVTDYYTYFKYRISVDGGATWAYDYADMPAYVNRLALTDNILNVSNFPLSNLGIASEGQINLIFQFGGNDTGSGVPNDGLTDDAAIYYDDTNPTAGTVSLNSGATYVNSSAVTAAYAIAPADAHSGLGSMRFSNNGSTWSSWEIYSATKVWDLVSGSGGSSSQGSRTVYAQVRDKAGNVSGNASDAITYDIGGPSAGTWQVNANASYSNISTVTVASTVAPADSYSGIASISFSNNNSTWSPWETYSGGFSKSWSLTTGAGGSSTQGTRTVYVRLLDGAGNVSTSASDAIVYDYSAPSVGKWYLSGNATYTNLPSNAFAVSTLPSDTYSGISQMCFSNNGTSWTAWEAYASSKTWDITNATYGGSATEGTRYSYVKVRDGAGNESSYDYDYITYDYTAPSVGVWRINLNNTYVNNATVSVAYTTVPSDVRSGISKIRFSNNGTTWSAWQTYASSNSWNITNTSYGGTTAEGTKFVYVQVQDGAGNMSASTYDSIIYDITAPVVSSFTIGSGNPVSTNSASVTLYISASDPGSGLFQSCYGNYTQPWSAWETYSSAKIWTLQDKAGSRRVYLRVKDNAGNETLINSIFDDITLNARISVAYTQLYLSNDGDSTGNGEIYYSFYIDGSLKLYRSEASYISVSSPVYITSGMPASYTIYEDPSTGSFSMTGTVYDDDSPLSDDTGTMSTIVYSAPFSSISTTRAIIGDVAGAIYYTITLNNP